MTEQIKPAMPSEHNSAGEYDPQLPKMAGPIWEHLIDDTVVEISLNGDGKFFVERFGKPALYAGDMAASDADRFVRYCASKGFAAHDADQKIISTKIVSMRHRLEAILPPNVPAPSFSIRRHRDTTDKIADFVPSPKYLGLIQAAIAGRKNILIAGGTSSGKTSFANACLDYLAKVAPNDRCVILEDTDEMRSPLANTLKLLSSERVSLGDLLVSTLRLAPKRIFVGEVREGIVAKLLLRSWNTGHPGGITTIHADSAVEVIPALQLLCMEVLPAGVDQLIGSALDMIIYMERGTTRPQVTQIALVEFKDNRLITMEIPDETPG